MEVGSTARNDAKSYSTLTFPVNLIRGYMILISLLCLTSIIVGMCLAIGENAKQYRTLSLLGMDKKKYGATLFAQMTFICVVSLIFALLVMGTFYFNIEKILLFTNIFMRGTLSALGILIIIFATIALSGILSVFFTRYTYKKLEKDYQMSFERSN